MITTVDVDAMMCSHLNSYLFQTVWNAPDLEHRQNLVLRIESFVPAKYENNTLVYPARATPLLGSVIINNKRITLPSENRYFVYTVPKCCLGSINVNVPHWVTMAKFINNNPLDLRVHGANGEWLWRDGIFIKNHTNKDLLIIAVDADMAEHILDTKDQKYNFMKLYMSVYLDSSRYTTRDKSVYTKQKSPTVTCYRPVTQEERNYVCSLIVNNYNQKIVFLNGREALITSTSDVNNYDYIEIVHDPDILSRIIIDLSQAGDKYRYRSIKHSTYKQLVHIPKSINSENKIITHHACDIFIRPTDKANSRLGGLYMHRFNTIDRLFITGSTTPYVNGGYDLVDNNTTGYNRIWIKGNYKVWYNTSNSRWELLNTSRNITYASATSNHHDPYNIGWTSNILVTDYSDDYITQVTHNDFAINEVLIDRYKEILGSSNVELHIMIRTHNRQKQLPLDGNFLKYLYRLSDNEIIEFLTDKGDTSLPFWAASHLETSRFTHMLYDVPEFVSKTNVSDYINALGYFHTLSALGGKIRKYTINNRLLVSNHKDIMANGLYTATNINKKQPTQNVWNNGAYRIVFSSATKKWNLTKSGIIIAEQQVPHNDPVMSEWTDITTPTNVVTVTSYMPRTFNVPIPLALLSAKQLTASVFIDGIKIDAERYSTVSEHQYLTITLDNDVELSYGGDLVVELFENTTTLCQVIPVTTTSAIYSNITKDMEFDVYLHTPSINITSNKYTQSTQFSEFKTGNANVCVKKKLTDAEKSTYITFHDDKYLKFKQAAVGKTFTIMSSNLYVNKKETINLSEHDKQSIILGPITIEQSTFIGGNKDVPIIQDKSFAIVYLNGRELAENVDFKYVTVTGTNNDPVCKIIVISNNEYLNKQNNVFEYIIISDIPFAKEVGFVHNKNISKINTFAKYYDRLSVLSQDGYTLKNINTSAWQLGIDSAREGAIYYLRSMAPRNTVEFVDKYGLVPGEIRRTQDVDIERLTAIIKFFRARTGVDNSIYLIQHSHHVHSLVLNEVVKDVLNESSELTYSDNKDTMLAQIASALTLRSYDPVLTGIINSVEIYGAQQAIVNGTYMAQDIASRGTFRKWHNNDADIFLEYDANSSTWEIKKDTAEGTIVYYKSAEDKNGKLDPWNLSWATAKNIDKSMPVLREIGETFDEIRIMNISGEYSGSYRLYDLYPTINDQRIWTQRSYSENAPKIMYYPAIKRWIIGKSTENYRYVSSLDEKGVLGPGRCSWSNTLDPSAPSPQLLLFNQIMPNGIVVEGADISAVNNLYRFDQPEAIGLERLWLNRDFGIGISYSVAHNRWIIKDITGTKKIYYQSELAPEDLVSPWDLSWEAVQQGDTSEPVLHSGNLNLKYIDIMPSYRHNETYDTEIYRCLIQLQKILFPTDATKDGRTVNLITE